MADRDPSRLWRSPSSKLSLGIPLGALIAFLLGAAALGATNWVLHQSSRTEFCYICHSHTAFIKPEYEASSHFSNAAGVRARCADCHVPDDWLGMVLLKTGATMDILPELMGKLGTREKFESHRREMAMTVWRDYLENDSRYCRTCHSLPAMVLDAQDRRAQRKHEHSEQQGQTCIECHQGLVHQLPENWKTAWDDVIGVATETPGIER